MIFVEIIRSGEVSPAKSRIISRPEDVKAAKHAKSFQASKRFTAHFRNDAINIVDLIWKNYEGENHVIKRGLQPGGVHVEMTYFTHPFVASDSVTQGLKVFRYNSKTGVVFEGEKFGVLKGDKVTISICDQLGL